MKKYGKGGTEWKKKGVGDRKKIYFLELLFFG
jgi:hypothetical protein